MAAAGGQADTPPDDSTLQGAYVRHRDRVFDLCYHYLGQVADAEDAVQETFARAARRLPTLTGDRGAYLLAVARNLCCNELRRRRRVVPVESIDREDRAIEAERDIVERAVLERLWVRLSPRERSMIHDTFAGFSQQEIAGRIGLSPNAVAVALLRARQRARTYASRALAGFLPLALAWRWTQRAVRRAATLPAEASSAIVLQIQQVGMVLTAAIVSALVAAPTVGGAAALTASRSGVGADAAASAADGVTAVAATRPGQASAGAENALAPSAPASALPAGPAALLAPIVDPGGNAPQQDVAFTSITPSPSYSNDHTVFASGFVVNGCAPVACYVIYRSNDGGVTWFNTHAKGFSGGRILLPPSWPADKTMFAIGSGGLLRSDDDVNFNVAVPTVATAASIAPDSAPGAARVLIGSNPLLVYSAAGAGSVSQGPVLPAGVELPDDVAYVGDSQHIEVATESVAGYNAASGQQTGVIVQCAVGACRTVATTPNLYSYRLLVSPTVAADHTVLAVVANSMLRSVDGGASFASSSLPVASGMQTLVAFAGTASRLAILAFADQRQDVMRWQVGADASHLPAAGLPTGQPMADLLALPGGRLLAADPANSTGQFGIECLSPGGTVWRYGC
jgi:RNA polymerase sigma-70 factor (ECF subfamily)